MSYTGNHIHNEGAYQNAIQNRIKENAITGRRTRWFKEDASREELIKRLHDLLHAGEGQFIATERKGDIDTVAAETNRSKAYIEKHYDHYSDTTTIIEEDDNGYGQIIGRWHKEKDGSFTFWRWQKPAKKRPFISPFFFKLDEAYRQWGSLTPGQEAALHKALNEKVSKDAEFEAKRKAEKEAVASRSTYVGQIKGRQDFTITLKNILHYETEFGTLIINIGHDASGNVIVYKGGTALGSKGDTVTFKATVKLHEERDGVKQTIVNRPKLAK